MKHLAPLSKLRPARADQADLAAKLMDIINDLLIELGVKEEEVPE